MLKKTYFFIACLIGLNSINAFSQDCNGIIINRPSSLIPNASLDDRTCCPDGVTPSGEEMRCIKDHKQASRATIDYHVKNCGESLDHPCITREPASTANGNGFLGIVYGSSKEYLGTCLTGDLRSGVDYTLKFKLGFGRSSCLLYTSPSPRD